jgi:hypothetical protein
VFQVLLKKKKYFNRFHKNTKKGAIFQRLNIENLFLTGVLYRGNFTNLIRTELAQAGT